MTPNRTAAEECLPVMVHVLSEEPAGQCRKCSRQEAGSQTIPQQMELLGKNWSTYLQGSHTHMVHFFANLAYKQIMNAKHEEGII